MLLHKVTVELVVADGFDDRDLEAQLVTMPRVLDASIVNIETLREATRGEEEFLLG